jgi:hypothetical protein
MNKVCLKMVPSLHWEAIPICHSLLINEDLWAGSLSMILIKLLIEIL